MAISEHLIAMLFALQKRLDIYQNQQKDHHWEKQTHMMVTEGSHVLVIGLGDIGTTFARKMKALGAHVTGIRKSRKPKPECTIHDGSTAGTSATGRYCGTEPSGIQ